MNGMKPDYFFNWEGIESVLKKDFQGEFPSYLRNFNPFDYIKNYGFDLKDPIQKGEIFGHFQESLNIIKSSFLEEGLEDGLPFKIPKKILELTQIESLLLLTTQHNTKEEQELSLWAHVILKLMHLIALTDKDIRFRYFKEIKEQIYRKYSTYLFQDSLGKMYLSSFKESTKRIYLKDFQVKEQKTRTSIILKLLNKENTFVEDVYDYTGFRIITENKLDCLKVLDFLVQHHVLILQNIRNQRSFNSLFPFSELKKLYYDFFKTSKEEGLTKEEFENKFQEKVEELSLLYHQKKEDNPYSLNGYKAIHVTSFELIRPKKKLYQELKELKKMANEQYLDHPLTEKINQLKFSALIEEVSFFYPYELQILDEESYKKSLSGEASHLTYKKLQRRKAICLLFKDLIAFKGMNSDDLLF